jgi:hypothetical protein
MSIKLYTYRRSKRPSGSSHHRTPLWGCHCFVKESSSGKSTLLKLVLLCASLCPKGATTVHLVMTMLNKFNFMHAIMHYGF